MLAVSASRTGSESDTEWNEEIDEAGAWPLGGAS